MNIRSIKGLGDKDTIEDYFDAPDPEVAPESPLSKDYYGRKIYVRKMESLYHLIRLYKTRDWLE